MMIKAKPPPRALLLGHEPIEWVSHFTYLGIQLDSHLNFNKEVQYLRQRASSRLSTMKFMTSLNEGANLQVQRLYYLACTRSLIDYVAPTLAHLSDAQMASLEVIQNNAIRTMLGAPMWARLCNIRVEAGLPPLKSRIATKTAAITAKALLSGRDS